MYVEMIDIFVKTTIVFIHGTKIDVENINDAMGPVVIPQLIK